MAQKQRARQREQQRVEEEEEVVQAADTTTNITIATNENIDLNFTRIQDLEQHGFHANDLKKLAEQGYCTVESIAFAPRKEIFAVKGIGEGKVEKLIVSFL
uniref:Uncharacterized protein n=1 Tax=Panagrolaimus sp. PS1159 TaxID=55785 RepID=A0AC35FL95_9BILA